MTTASHVDEFQSQGQSPGLIRETTSPTGHRVTFAIEQATYQGAQPTYYITRWTKTGRPMEQRYVPVVYGALDDRRPTPRERRHAQAEARALAIFEALAGDAEIPRSRV